MRRDSHAPVGDVAPRLAFRASTERSITGSAETTGRGFRSACQSRSDVTYGSCPSSSRTLAPMSGDFIKVSPTSMAWTFPVINCSTCERE